MFRKIRRQLQKQLSKDQEPSSTANIPQEMEKPIEINIPSDVHSVAFSVDGGHVMSAGLEGKIRHWRVEDGMNAGAPMDVGSAIQDIAVSKDNKWVVCGTGSGMVTVWNAESRAKVIEFKGHKKSVNAVDISSDGTVFATGSPREEAVSVWSLATGRQVLGPLPHTWTVVGVRFSPNGRFIATATWSRESVRIYDSRNGRLLANVPLQVNSPYNRSLVWATDSKQLYVLSRMGEVHCLDASGNLLFKWPVHTKVDPTCISMTADGAIIAVAANSLVSFWNTSTRNQVGSVIEHNAYIWSMAISTNGYLAIAGAQTITLHKLNDILPYPYSNNELPHTCKEAAPVEERSVDISQKGTPNGTCESVFDDPSAQEQFSDNGALDVEQTIQKLRTQLTDARVDARKAIQERDVLIQQLAQAKLELYMHEQKHDCETLYAQDRTMDAASSLLKIMDIVGEEAGVNKLLINWLSEFTERCSSKLEKHGDDALNAKQYVEALEAYSAVLSLSRSAPNNVLDKWVCTMLIHGSVNDCVCATTKFKLPRLTIYRSICDVLEREGRIAEAIAFFGQMHGEFEADVSTCDEQMQWELNFQKSCADNLEKLAQIAINSENYDQANNSFSVMMSLNAIDRTNVLVKRSRVRTMMNSWVDALSDADEAIGLDPSSYLGYEQRHAALRGLNRHTEAVEAFEMMLSKIDQSPDERVRKLRSNYIDAKCAIRHTLHQTLNPVPQVLIDTATGHVYDKKQLANAFEEQPVFDELVSSMTTELDDKRIGDAVKEFCRYVMLSHTWEQDEPLLQKLKHVSIYDLESSTTNIKLQKFCSLVHSIGIRWAWTDTTCVDQKDNVVLQESLVAMFTWYRGSSLTIVYLRGVSSESHLPGSLQRSVWNTRGWTYQEYVAAETVQFYTEDWKPYLGLELCNHKELPIIISEMQQATGVLAQEMAVLQPGLDRVREKLYVASMRQTTRMEDMAYSLLGIFSASIPVIYGEGDRAIGRLLEHILSGSGDVSVLAWTGRAGGYNSCLPVDLRVYNQLVPPHIPQPIEADEMDDLVETLRSSFADLTLTMTLHNELKALPAPFIVASRLRLAGIVCPLAELTCTLGPSPTRIYRATTSLFGDIEIKTTDDLTGMENLSVIHPWVRPLLEQEFRAGIRDKVTQALRLVARLRQSFGVLLLQPVTHIAYKRVASDCLTMVRVREGVSLKELIDGIDTVEIQ